MIRIMYKMRRVVHNQAADREQSENTGVVNRATGSSYSEQNIDSDNEQESDRDCNTGEGVCPLVTQNEMTQKEMEQNVCDDNSVCSASVKLKTGQTVTFMKGYESVPCRVKVLGRAGKTTGPAIYRK